MGQRILRREDSRFLVGNGSYVENMDATRRAPCDVRPLPARARADRRRSTPRPRELPGHTGLHGGGRRSRARSSRRRSRDRPADGAALPRQRRRSLRRRHRRRRRHASVAPYGVDAAELVCVDYDPLPAVVDPEQALAGDVLLFPERGHQRLREPSGGARRGSVRRLRRRRLGAPREPALAALPAGGARSCAAVVGDDGRLTLWLSTQTPHQDRHVLAADPRSRATAGVRVVAPDVGGGFGAKRLGVEEVLVSWLARQTARPVRWTETRSENMIAMPHGRAAVLEFTIGGTRDGDVQAYRLRSRAGRRRLSAHRRDPAGLHGADGERRLRDPEDRDRVHGQRRHEHDADRAVPRRRPTGGDTGDRARDGPVRAGARARPRRGAPTQPLRRRTPSR